jgi:hypothetical protein
MGSSGPAITIQNGGWSEQVNSGFAQLVQSLAAYSPSVGGFSTMPIPQPPNDPSLVGTIAAGWRR